MNGKYFTPLDRKRIAKMWRDYDSVLLIADALNVSPSTVNRELKLGNADGELDRNQRLAYDAELAQLRFQENLRRRGRKAKV